MSAPDLAKIQKFRENTEVAAPFHPLLGQLTPEKMALAKSEVLTGLRKFWTGKELNTPLKIVTGTGTGP